MRRFLAAALLAATLPGSAALAFGGPTFDTLLPTIHWPAPGQPVTRDVTPEVGR
ncbi:hypothetical protein [Jannaschia ovalis]|uniref:Uncharacterized protein n=1 Tax=Jannaschia ovalis TaxID=3038773 RepID=A0ABY8LFF5_9RHOB|nr:hypothetical protein [Jannaschia sp. GRR-S6-38]WGH80037.1 hypothetical protein P8627_07185 [Jannaschia sp. GRR-S6-38]